MVNLGRWHDKLEIARLVLCGRQQLVCPYLYLLRELSSIVRRDYTLVGELNVNGLSLSKSMSSDPLHPLTGNCFDADFPCRDSKEVLKRNPYCVQDNPV